MLVNRRVKIVATIGPATQDVGALEKAIRAGMNVARLNFSHGTHEDHLKVVQNLRKLSRDLRAPVTILQDLQGHKVRVGKFENGSIELVPGAKVTITMKPDWAQAVPQSARLLREEAVAWQKTPWTLSLA